MKTFLKAKVAQVPAFETALIESSASILAESSPDRFWASGLSNEVTGKANPQTWTGLNKLVHLMMDIRQSILTEKHMEPEENTSLTLQQSPGEEDTDCEFFNTHEDEIFIKKTTAVQKTDSNSTVSADSEKSMHTATVEKPSYKDAASNLSNIGTTAEKTKTQSRLSKKILPQKKNRNYTRGYINNK